MHRSLGLACAAAVAAIVLPISHGLADSLTTLASFSDGTDGAMPLAPLAADSHGHLYGTTSQGANGAGTLFEVTPGKKLKTLYAFCSQTGCKDEASPHAGLILDSQGNLYGTTYGGGANSSGTVFEATPKGVETVLYSFCSVVKNGHCGDGSAPLGGVTMDSAGNLYGTTASGGDNDFGAVFEVAFNGKKGTWTEKTLYSFCPESGCADGQAPAAGVIMDKAGNLYGTTQLGGAFGQGAVFEINARHKKETVLYSFCAQSGCADGAEPYAGVIMDKSGNLYGTTKYGGNPNCGNGGGTVFELGNKSQESVLYAFCSVEADADGSYPEAGLVADKKGNLYGTTTTGGSSSQGVVFELAGTTETVLYSFCSTTGCPEFPTAGVIMNKAGDLFGTTSSGGTDGYGTVFELTP
ncbi:MAG TPA: choice-of-anchor tandem repeat GloVer-containing protein [Rhizomicrobium sp.]|nr:choice-of-anchor tandem repeat GloVer-containing protein [Rhizomicrobium sp.]